MLEGQYFKMRWELLSSCYLTRKCAKTVLGGALNIGPLVTPKSSAPLPKNVGRLISDYVDCKKGFVFFTLTTC